MVPTAALGLISGSNEAVAGTSAPKSSILAKADETAPECAVECIRGYLDETIDADTLEAALVDLEKEGRITRTQLNSYLGFLYDGDLDSLRSLCDAGVSSKEDGGNSAEKDDPDDSSEGDSAGSEDEGADDADDSDASDEENSDDGDDVTGDDADLPTDGAEDETEDPIETEDPDDADASDEGSSSNAGESGDDVTEAPQPSSNGASASKKQGKHILSQPKSGAEDKEAQEEEASKSDSQRSIKVTRATHDMSTEAFIAVIGEQARQIGQERGIYASVMIAQAILESGSGSSLLSSAPFYNLFGIKGSYEGKSVQMKTQEDDGEGNYSTITAGFRDYSSFSESLNDYADLLTVEQADFYEGALKANAETPEEAAAFLQGRYATSTTYAQSLNQIIATYKLARFDEPLPYETDETYMVDVLNEEGETVSEERTIADLLATATSYLGEDYVWGGATPETGFDCSGLVQYSYSTALGIDLPRTTYVQCKVGEEVALSDLHPGDLLFFDREGDIHHVAMYLGNGFYIHAPQTGDVIKVTALEEYTPSFAMRIISTHERGEEVEEVDSSLIAKQTANEISGALDSVMENVGRSISESVAVVIEND